MTAVVLILQLHSRHCIDASYIRFVRLHLEVCGSGQKLRASVQASNCPLILQSIQHLIFCLQGAV